MRALCLVTAAVVLLGCDDSDKPTIREDTSAETETRSYTAEEDVAMLGREIYDLVDRAMSYRSAHRGRLPRNLRELGIDELTPTTARALSVHDNVPTVAVNFRSTTGHIVSGCQGTSRLLEESTLGGGEYSLQCTLVAGGNATLKAQR